MHRQPVSCADHLFRRFSRSTASATDSPALRCWRYFSLPSNSRKSAQTGPRQVNARHYVAGPVDDLELENGCRKALLPAQVATAGLADRLRPSVRQPHDQVRPEGVRPELHPLDHRVELRRRRQPAVQAAVDHHQGVLDIDERRQLDTGARGTRDRESVPLTDVAGRDEPTVLPNTGSRTSGPPVESRQVDDVQRDVPDVGPPLVHGPEVGQHNGGLGLPENGAAPDCVLGALVELAPRRCGDIGAVADTVQLAPSQHRGDRAVVVPHPDEVAPQHEDTRIGELTELNGHGVQDAERTAVTPRPSVSLWMTTPGLRISARGCQLVPAVVGRNVR